MTLFTLKTLLLGFLIPLVGNPDLGKIDSYLSELHKNGNLNGNVLVLKDGIKIYENSFGYADGSKSELLNKDHRFNVGSVYKEFPAVCIMQLVEKNQLSLDDKISVYFPELPLWSQKISVKNLLQYSSGLPKIDFGSYFEKGLALTDADIFKDLQKIETLKFKPGTDYLYSNNNPLLLIKIVERISKIPFNEYLEKNIFAVVGMNSTILKMEYPYIDATLMAIPFDEKFKEDAFKMKVNGPLLSATASDMARWFESLVDFKIISQKSMKLLSETAIEDDTIEAPLGSCIWEDGVILEHTHHGSSGNYECLVSTYEKDGITIVVLTNQKHGNVHDITETIRVILSDKL